MHPSHVHKSMADEPSSALRLGFADIKAPEATPSGPQMTPSKFSCSSAQFTFDFTRHAVAESQLSDEAQRLMDDLRERASRIKADLVAQRQAEGQNGERKIATAKGKSGRFSAAHMAEFKKMDSIEGHASAWRAQDGRFTPVVAELKRSPSKNNLEASPTPLKRGIKRSPSKADLDAPITTPLKSSLKRTISRANLEEPQITTPGKRTPLGTTPRKAGPPPFNETPGPMSAAKRVKKREQDDATSSRPVSRDGSSLPRPKSSAVDLRDTNRTHATLSRLASPTKASMAHSASQLKPTITLVKSASNANLGNLAKSPSVTSLASTSRAAELGRRIISPNRLQRVTSLLRKKNKATGEADNTAIPKPAITTSQTPNPPRYDKALPPVPLTTPRRKLSKHVSFTPDTIGFSAGDKSPSPAKSVSSRLTSWRANKAVQYPALDGILKKSTSSDDVSYPDLSVFKSPVGSTSKTSQKPPDSVPGAFTFRSDHTIEFNGASAKGFGASPGQASVRHVRGSIMPTMNMPGNFPEPASPTSHPNKENSAPAEPFGQMKVVPHGMTNKKRHRPTWDEDEMEQEMEERAAKKRKNEVPPEGQAVVAPRRAVATPSRSARKMPPGRAVSRTPGSASPTKKSSGLSLSRLNMLARPKNRV